MASTIDMQHMRYLNLFEQMTRIRTRYCFKYNETIFFCVPKQMVSKAIGKEGKNVKQINRVLEKKIKIIPYPNSISDAESFIEDIVSPVTFKDVQIEDNTLILNASSQSKAALIGRNKRRFLEMQKIVSDFFGKEFKIA